MSQKLKNNEEQFESIKEIFLNNYSPGNFNEMPVTFMSTRMIYNSLYQVYPNKDFTPDIVAAWLIEFGYKTFNTGNMCIEWIVKENT